MRECDKTIDDVKESARESFLDALEYENFESFSDLKAFEPHDMIFETADSSVPVYTYDLLTIAASDLWLATETPDLGPAFDGSPTPVNIIAANIFEAIEADLWEYWQDVILEGNENETLFPEGPDNYSEDQLFAHFIEALDSELLGYRYLATDDIEAMERIADHLFS